MGYLSDRQWGDQFIPEMTRILAPLLGVRPETIKVAAPELDKREATDLIVLEASNRRIACRMRRSGFQDRYPNDFTIRCWRENEMETEFGKILKGWGDFLFYGHAVVNGKIDTIGAWMLIDLAVFRFYWKHNVELFTAIGKPIRNHEKRGERTALLAFDVSAFPMKPNLLIARESPL